jgi:exopolysaccharide production protein ExoQ
MATAIRSMTILSTRSVSALVASWFLMVPLLYLAAQGAPSIDRQDQNVADTGQGHYESYANQKVNSSTESIRKKIELLIVYSMVLFSIWSYAPRFKAVLIHNKILLLLPLFALISTLWSQAPFTTFESALGVIIILLLGVFLTLRFSAEQQISLLLMLGVAVMTLSIMLVVLFPSAGIDRFYGSNVWQGICNQKNKFATTMVYLLMPAFYCRVPTFHKKAMMTAYVAIGVLCVIMSQARTGWLLMATSLCVAMFIKLQTRFTSKERLLWSFALFAIAVVSIWAAFTYYAQVAVFLGKDPTLTGRTEIYKAILFEVLKEPLWGYGYVAFFTGNGEWLNFALRSGLTGLGNAENPVLQIWLDLGLIGVACLFLSLFQACSNIAICLVNRPSKYVQWCTLMVFLNLAALLGGDKIMFPHTIEWLLYVVGFIGLSAEAHRIRTGRHA